MLLGQMLPGILPTKAESGNVIAAFLMFWSDVGLVMLDQHHFFPGMHLNLSRSHSHDLFVCKQKTANRWKALYFPIWW